MKKYLFLILLLITSIAKSQTADPAPTSSEAKVYSTIKEELGEKDLKKFMRNISDTFRYPAESRRKGIEGTVFIDFAIEPNGATSGFLLTKGVSPDLDAEAMRALKVVAEKTPWKKSDKIRWISFPFKFKLG